MPVTAAVIFGGVSQVPQVEAIERGADILIATPGRLWDLMGQKIVKLNKVETFVLDEADRMLDMGFFPDVKRIVKQLPAKRQRCCSPRRSRMRSPTLRRACSKIRLRSRSRRPRVRSRRSSSRFLFVEKAEKRTLLPEIIRRANVHQTLVFTRTKHGADRVARDLNRAGILTQKLHPRRQVAEHSASARCIRLQGMQDRRCSWRPTSPRAASTLAELPLVINFELPNIPETYVRAPHRPHRPRRAGGRRRRSRSATGPSVPYLADIEKLIGIRIPVAGEIPHDESKDKEKLEKQRRAFPAAAGRRRDTTSENASAEAVAEEAEREKQAKRKARTAREDGHPAKSRAAKGSR